MLLECFWGFHSRDSSRLLAGLLSSHDAHGAVELLVVCGGFQRLEQEGVAYIFSVATVEMGALEGVGLVVE